MFISVQVPKNNNIEPCLVYVQMWTLALRSKAGEPENTEGSNTEVRQQKPSVRAAKHLKKQQQRNKQTKKNWTSEQSKRSRIKLKGNTEWRPSFLLHFNQPQKQWTKLMVYIFIFIYLKCNMVQKYRRSAAPRYIYKINTPFRQNKLPPKKIWHNWNKKEKSKDSQRLKSVASQSIKYVFFFYHILLFVLLYLEYLQTINIFQFLSKQSLLQKTVTRVFRSPVQRFLKDKDGDTG